MERYSKLSLIQNTIPKAAEYFTTFAALISSVANFSRAENAVKLVDSGYVDWIKRCCDDKIKFEKPSRSFLKILIEDKFLQPFTPPLRVTDRISMSSIPYFASSLPEAALATAPPRLPLLFSLISIGELARDDQSRLLLLHSSVHTFLKSHQSAIESDGTTNYLLLRSLSYLSKTAPQLMFNEWNGSFAAWDSNQSSPVRYFNALLYSVLLDYPPTAKELVAKLGENQVNSTLALIDLKLKDFYIPSPLPEPAVSEKVK